jgi:hypothetical protein
MPRLPLFEVRYLGQPLAMADTMAGAVTSVEAVLIDYPAGGDRFTDGGWTPRLGPCPTGLQLEPDLASGNAGGTVIC